MLLRRRGWLSDQLRTPGELLLGASSNSLHPADQVPLCERAQVAGADVGGQRSKTSEASCSASRSSTDSGVSSSDLPRAPELQAGEEVVERGVDQQFVRIDDRRRCVARYSIAFIAGVPGRRSRTGCASRPAGTAPAMRGLAEQVHEPRGGPGSARRPSSARRGDHDRAGGRTATTSGGPTGCCRPAPAGRCPSSTRA